MKLYKLTFLILVSSMLLYCNNFSHEISDSVNDSFLSQENTETNDSLQVIYAFPENNQVNVYLNSAILLYFNTDVQSASISSETITVKDDTDQYISGTFSIFGNKVIIFKPVSGFSNNTIYYVTVTDVKSNDEVIMKNSYNSQFTTGTSFDTTPPEIIETNPANNALTESVTEIRIIFNEDILPTTITNDTLIISDGLNIISGVTSYKPDTKEIIFTPQIPLEKNKVYSVTVKNTVTDLAENFLTNDYEFSFSLYDATSSCVASTTIGSENTQQLIDGTNTATVMKSGYACNRTFSISTTATLKENIPSNPRIITEQTSAPSINTNNDMFDALYSLALRDIQENSVNSISDSSYNNGNPIACPTGGCYTKGKLDNFIWTRDIGYAVDLALASLDPIRSKNSLQFKLSTLRTGGNTQIMQDTGTGGSYPISSDRVVWALGAWQVLKYLSGTEYSTFLNTAFEAIQNTVEHDRTVVYDATSGLYHGEQSYFDWQEQTYPAWLADSPIHINMSYSLSTNIAQFRTLEIAALLATEKGNSTLSNKYQTWASALKIAIQNKFYLADKKLYASMTSTYLDQAAIQRFDLLSSSLAVIHNIANETILSDIVKSYPHVAKGPSIIWPQQKNIPIYLNRALWPFATAYWLLAAKNVKNDAAINHNVNSLMRGAAINLSNMQNYEYLTGDPYKDDGANSGPVNNSHRHLLSAAGYIAMVQNILFGLDASQNGIRFLPYITRYIRNVIFKNAGTIVLNNFTFKNKALTVIVKLPNKTTDNEGAYSIGEIKFNNNVIGNAYIESTSLLDNNQIEITLTDIPESAKSITTITNTSAENLFAPATPQITGLTLNSDKIEITFNPNGENTTNIAFNIYRDGLKIAANVLGTTTVYTDSSTTTNSPSYCYSVESYYISSGNVSYHSQPVCYWGNGSNRVQSVPANSFSANGGNLVNAYGKWYYDNWGDPGHSLTLSSFTPTYTGDHLLYVLYANGTGSIDTGITCAIKLLVIKEGLTTVGSGLLIMPQLGAWSAWKESNFIKVALDKTKTYSIEIYNDTSSINMSSFNFYNNYTGGTGGDTGAYYKVNIAELKVLSLTNN